MKNAIVMTSGAVSALITWLCGGWTGVLSTLAVFMLIDYIGAWGSVLFYGVSKHNPDGTLSSRVAGKGLFKKIFTLLLLIVGYRLEVTMNHTIKILDIMTYMFITVEVLSITETAELCGIKVPVLGKAVRMIEEKEGL